MLPKRKNILLSEFVVEVYPDRIVWNGLDRFILVLMNQRPEAGYLKVVRSSRGLRGNPVAMAAKRRVGGAR